MLNFVFQELPLWGGAAGQPCFSNSLVSLVTSCVYKEARNTGFLDDWVLILFLLHLTKYSYLMVPQFYVILIK